MGGRRIVHKRLSLWEFGIFCAANGRYNTNSHVGGLTWLGVDNTSTWLLALLPSIYDRVEVGSSAPTYLEGCYCQLVQSIG